MPISDGLDALTRLSAAPPRPKHHVQPLTYWTHDDRLNCSVRHGAGYRYYCTRDGYGERRATWAMARADLAEHRKVCE